MSLSTVQSTFPSFDDLLLDCAKAKICKLCVLNLSIELFLAVWRSS